MPTPGKLTRVVILLPLLLFACATKMPPLTPYPCKVTELTYLPLIRQCDIVTKDDRRKVVQCITLLDTDYYELVVELKACCLGSGQSKEQCQAQDEPKEDEPIKPIWKEM